MQRTGRLSKALKAGAGIAVAALIMAACGSSTTSPSTTASGGGTPAPSHKTGGTVSWALPPAATPNWIFPFSSLAYFSVTNLTQFQYLMYRPLFWFGQTTSSNPTYDATLSLGTPTFTNGGKSVTITMKGWKFSNGQTIDAQSVILWMNMMKAEKANWAGYVPTYFPDNVTSYSAPDGLTGLKVTMNFDKAYGANWLLYNEISQITPMPEAWDITSLSGAAGSGGCGQLNAPTSKCAAVWAFDTDNNGKAKSPQMSGDLATYASNPAWQVVDGPWRLSAFNASNGESTFVPNPKYSGPQKPIISKFIEVPFTTDTAEFNALAGGGSGAPQVGYASSQVIPPNSGPVGSVGQNASQVSSNYNLVPVYSWGINYFPENFNSTGDNGAAGAIFKQLYVRQALQEGIDQTGIIKAFDKGYGVPTYGPVPVYPKNSFASAIESNNPYPYSIANGTKLLSDHGWTINKGGIDTCAKPGSGAGQCGAGIPQGAQLNFTELWATGNQATQQTVNAEVSAWSQMGIHVNTKGEPFNQVIGASVPCKASQGSACSWEMTNWGGGWVYSPDYLPTGEELFSTGAGSNSGSYSDPTNDANILKTTTSSDPSYLTTYENYLAQQLPVVWQPNPAYELTEVAKNLTGVTPINALLNLTPEYWAYTS